MFQRLHDTWLLDGVRTPFVDYQGAFADANPIDLGIKVAREVLARTGIDPARVDGVVTGNMAPGGFDQFYVARHVGLYAGVPLEVGALNVQRICGTGFEIFRQAGEQIGAGVASLVLAVGTESMTRNPIAMFDHRQGFRLGAPVALKDFMWEALTDPAAVSMIRTAENLAVRHGIAREAVDAFAARSFERAVAAQQAGWFAGEIVAVADERFEAPGCRPRTLKLAGRRGGVVDRDTHPRPTTPEALAALRPVFDGGVQTAGNSSALVDGAVAALVGSGAAVRDWGREPLARVAAAAVVGVAPEFMGFGPVPAIRRLLEGAGLAQDEIARFEVNEAQGAQVLAVAQALALDPARLNVHGGAIALGHPLAATGARLVLTLARDLRAAGARWGVASACVGGGQGIALLIENPRAA